MKSFTLAAFASVVAAFPSKGVRMSSFDCGLVTGLSSADCLTLQKAIAPGPLNSHTDNGGIWIGNDGPNTFNFHGDAGQDIVMVAWMNTDDSAGGGSWINKQGPQIVYPLRQGDKLTLSLANGVSGGFSAFYNSNFTMPYGMVWNTWGEFTTFSSDQAKPKVATIDISREVNMGGAYMSIKTNGQGCVSEYTQTSSKCVFTCDTIEDSKTDSCTNAYTLKDCDMKTNPGANYQAKNGGCSGGWTSADISFLSWKK